ncbi:hypothetical protein ACJJTC_010622 [Scirpophaga incertulas]
MIVLDAFSEVGAQDIVRAARRYAPCSRAGHLLRAPPMRDVVPRAPLLHQLIGPSKPIFISENLTAKVKKLFYLSREFAKTHAYKFCWVTNGKIFLRKKENGTLSRIERESDLASQLIDK